MSKIGTISKTKEILEEHDFHIKKKFGQNFLTDQNVLRNIVQIANINSSTLVIEIGPGIGSLTELLLQEAGHVLAYEIDADLIPILNKQFDNQNVTLIHGDFLDRQIDEDIHSLAQEYSRTIVVANLPYYITTPIIMKLLEESKIVSELYVMMQYEVAKRFTSNPSTKDYNSLSVFIQFKTDSTIALKIPKSVFIPAPNVDSAVVKMLIKDQYERFPKDEHLFYRIVRKAFSMRRKTLVNNLMDELHKDKEDLKNSLIELGYSPSVRAESLTVDDFITLSDYFSK